MTLGDLIDCFSAGDSGKLYPYEEDQHDMVRWWFNKNLERPTRFTTAKAPFYRRKNRALSWFKDPLLNIWRVSASCSLFWRIMESTCEP
jgi:hypothetical protein